MAIVDTIWINGWNSGWTGTLGAIDERVSSADGANCFTSTNNKTVVFDFGATSLSDSDTIDTVKFTVRARSTAGGEPPISTKLEIELLIGGVTKGTFTTADIENGTFQNWVASNAGWNVDWTAAQLNGLQCRVKTQINPGSADATLRIDCIDCVITTVTVDTPRDPGKVSRTLTGKVPTLKREDKVTPGRRTVALSGKAPTDFHQYFRPTLKGSVALSEKSVTIKREDNVHPSEDILTFSTKTPLRISNFIGRPLLRTAALNGKTPTRLVRFLRPMLLRTVALAGKVPDAPVTAHHVALPARVSRTLAPEAPLTPTTTNNFVGPGRGLGAITGKAPTLDQETSAWIDTLTGTGVLAGQAPTPVDSQVRPPAAGAIAVTGELPSRVPSTVLPVTETSIAFSTTVPHLGPLPATLSLTLPQPTAIVDHMIFAGAPDALVIQGQDVLANNAAVAPAAADLTLTGYIPTMSFSSFFAAGPTRFISLSVDRRIEFIATPTKTLID